MYASSKFELELKKGSIRQYKPKKSELREVPFSLLHSLFFRSEFRPFTLLRYFEYFIRRCSHQDNNCTLKGAGYC